MANPISVPGTVVPSGSLISPGGAQGLQGLQGSTGIPSGAIMDYAGATAPAGWLLCDGSAVSRTTYATLFAAISTTFGTGDGSTTFNLPDARGRVGVGSGLGSGLTNRALAANGGEEAHALSVAELAAHNHTATQPAHGHTMNDPTHAHVYSQLLGGLSSWAFNPGTPFGVSNGNTNGASTGVTTQTAQPAITVNNNGSGTPLNIMQPFIVFNKIIKT